MKQDTRPGRRKAVGAAVLVVAALATGAGAVALLSGPRLSPGEQLNEWRGNTSTNHYDALEDIPAETAPTWLPAKITDIMVKEPGKNQDEASGTRKIDGIFPSDWSIPLECTPTQYSQPWDGGGNWPLTLKSKIMDCPDGPTHWHVMTQAQRVYLWK